MIMSHMTGTTLRWSQLQRHHTHAKYTIKSQHACGKPGVKKSYKPSQTPDCGILTSVSDHDSPYLGKRAVSQAVTRTVVWQTSHADVVYLLIQKVDEDSAQDAARGRQTRHEQVSPYPASQGCLRIFSVQGQLCQLLLQCCPLPLHSQQAAA